MEKDRYFYNIRDFAWQLLIQHHVKSLPLDVFAFADSCQILLVPYSRLAEVTDLAVTDIEHKYNPVAFNVCVGKNRVYYNDTAENIGFLRFSIMHEIAHLLLLHIVDDAEREKEAKMLASRLLAPLTVIDKCGIQSAEELSTLCGISYQAAEIRFARLQRKRREGYIDMSKLEREVASCFATFINEYRAMMKRK